MTDMKKQQELMEMIERLLAGNVDVARDDSPHGTRDEELQKLMSLAEELSAGKAEPTPEFEERLEGRLAELMAESAVPDKAEADARGARTASSDSGKVRWAPSWLTMPRIAAVAAALVISLGLVGVTGALIRGGYQGKTSAETSAVSQNRATENGTLSKEQTADSPAPQGTVESAVGDASGLAAPGGTAASDGAGESTVAPLPSSQRIIQTADYRIEIVPGEFDDKYAQISAVAIKYGGYVISGDARMGNDGLKNGSISIRVANTSDNFNKAQAEIDGLGNVTSRKISGQDVTEEYVDLQSRLRNAEAQEAQYLALMQRAQTIEEILSVQSRLAQVQSEIEQIKGRMKYMEGRTDFATISIDLRETGEGTPADDGGTDWGFVDSIRYAGWLSVQTVNFVIVALGVIVPLVILGGGLALLIYRVIQKRRAGRNNGD